MNKMSTILQGLIGRTEEEKLKWRTMLEDDVFVASVDTTAVIVRKLDIRYQLKIMNEQGATVIVLETGDIRGIVPKEQLASREQAKGLRRLFELARHSALDPDSTLDKLARDLERIR